MHAHSQRPYCGYVFGTARKKQCNLSLIVHNIHVTVLVLHLYHGILMSIFITQMKILIRMTLCRCNHQYDHDVLNVFWSVKAENLAYEQLSFTHRDC